MKGYTTILLLLGRKKNGNVPGCSPMYANYFLLVRSIPVSSNVSLIEDFSRDSLFSYFPPGKEQCPENLSFLDPLLLRMST
jgi:hypothetical protein